MSALATFLIFRLTLALSVTKSPLESYSQHVSMAYGKISTNTRKVYVYLVCFGIRTVIEIQESRPILNKDSPASGYLMKVHGYTTYVLSAKLASPCFAHLVPWGKSTPGWWRKNSVPSKLDIAACVTKRPKQTPARPAHKEVQLRNPLVMIISYS